MASGGQENGATNGGGSRSSNPDQSKLFIGGLTVNTTNEMMQAFFGQYGTVVDSIVMTDPSTGRSRCFGFVTLGSPEEADNAMSNRPHVIDGRSVDSKRAIPKSLASNNPEMKSATTKLFVPGVRPEHTDQSLREYFEGYGKVVKIDVRQDKGFAFVEFEDPDAVTKCALEGSHYIQGHRCDVKKAQEKAPGGGPMRRGGMRGGAGGGFGGRPSPYGGGRGGGGGYGGRGGGQQGGYNQYGGQQGGYNQYGGGYQQQGYAQPGYGAAQPGYAGGYAAPQQGAYGGYQAGYQQPAAAPAPAAGQWGGYQQAGYQQY